MTASIRSAFPLMPLTPILGREDEVRRGVHLVQATRLVTLTGPGGVGKTRLALEIADAVATSFPGGVFFVPLAGVLPGESPLPSIATALEIEEGDNRTLEDAVCARLGDSRTLVILDNAEHLIDRMSELARVLERSPLVTAFVTSRSCLRLRGEQEFPVEPLAVPAREVSGDLLRSAPAVALFAAMSRGDATQILRNEDDLAAVAEIVRRLDGLPLAIELAAARSAVLPPRSMLARFDRRLALLTGGPRDLPQRQKTLRDAIMWSYELLPPRAQSLFRVMSLLPGGVSLDVLQIGGAPDVEALSVLIDHSLVRQSPGSTPPRYQMLETVRELGSELAAEHGEIESMRADLSARLTQLASNAAAALTGPRQAERLDWFASEQANLRACMGWAIERGDAEDAVTIGGAIGRFWLMRGKLSEGREWLGGALALPGGETAARAVALTAFGAIVEEQDDHRLALEAYQESLAISRANEDEYGIARATNNIGLVQTALREYEAAAASFEEALAGFAALGHESATAVTMMNLARVADRVGNAGQAQRLLERALPILRRLGDDQRLAWTLQSLGLVATSQGELDRAEALFVEAIALWEPLGDMDSVGWTLAHRARLARLRGEPAVAARLAGQAMGLAVSEDGDRLTAALCCLELAVIAWQRDEPSVAARLLGLADAENEWRAAPFREDERVDYDRAVTALRGSLGREAFEQLALSGAAEGIDVAVRAAVQFREPPINPSVGESNTPFGLSARELDVAKLLVEGLSDREIGERLFISHRTVMRHVGSVLTKMRVTSRTAAAGLVVRAGLG